MQAIQIILITNELQQQSTAETENGSVFLNLQQVEPRTGIRSTVHPFHRLLYCNLQTRIQTKATKIQGGLSEVSVLIYLNFYFYFLLFFL